MTADALDVFDGLDFANEDERKDIDVVVSKLEKYGIGETNETYGWYCFNKRDQESHETVDAYFAALRTLAKTCNFGNLEDNLIRDRIVIGIKDNATQNKLLQVSKLTLQQSIDIVLSCEKTAKQLELMKAEEIPESNTKNKKPSGVVTPPIQQRILAPDFSLTSVTTSTDKVSVLPAGILEKDSFTELLSIGTPNKLQNMPNASTYQDSVVEMDLKCNKDTGGFKALHFWSRGMFFIVSAGGHIEYWQPLYKSESPTQAFLITVLWLYRKFKTLEELGHSQETIINEMTSTVLAYDNMCHMDNLIISRSHLPFPYPFNEMWQRIGKVIDRLHLRNHVDEKCHNIYNPDDKIPKEFNTMACEQTFVWASRFKKVMCAMPHIHQFFFLHRMVKYRNTYTEKCHVRSKVPILPKKIKI
ncbi:Hypothetical predicted protein [Paramuricea clavata]|uniref:Uncharacterized protein n=1 Tax=Paramuricea clavata TaxID=317549 RepID=A0A7D9H8A5_PARCT|nr:Hypothetical predicted protein [Paramuricea clavata]